MLVLQFVIYFIGLFLVYRTGIRRGYSMGYGDALVLKVKEFIKVSADEQSKND